MKRYFRLYLLLIRVNFSALLAYRANFVNGLIGTTGWSLVSLLSMFLLTSRTSSVYGWTPNELLTVAGIYIILIGIFHTLFSKNFERFSLLVHLGQLDSILLKPVDSQFLLSLWYLNYASIFRIGIGVFFVGYMLEHMHVSITIFTIGGFILFGTAGIILLYSVWYAVLTLTIWFTNLSNLVDFLYAFNYFARFPPEMILQARNFFLYLVLPITFVATIPAKVVLLENPIEYMFLLLFFSLLFLFLSRMFWKFALKFYTSAGG